MDREQLTAELTTVLAELDALQASAVRYATLQGMHPMDQRYADGSLALAPLVAARAQALAALAALEASR